MTHATHDDGRLFPFDPETITGIRIDGSPGVTPVDSGTAEVVDAGGEIWFYWEHEGLRRAVNSRHIAEVFANRRRRVIDLTDAERDYTRLRSASHAKASS